MIIIIIIIIIIIYDFSPERRDYWLAYAAPCNCLAIFVSSLCIFI
jgi:hypothetical protein